MVKMTVQKRHSEKKGTDYCVLNLDFGFQSTDVFVKADVLMLLADVSPKELFALKVGEKLSVKVGE